mmetsp:Transcript_7355/g.7759  ORF Transcript_7355/g.7759 Transcript_7355/m.7759 type:complete len:460 (-) Transcript_7355:128-1507(-)
MVLLSRPVFSSWNLFNSNSFPNFKILHVATKSSSWNPFGPSNDAAQEFKDKANESMTKFDATSKMIKEFVETVTKKLISLFNYPATWIVTLSCFGLFLFFYPKGKLIALDAISWIPRTISYSRITDSTAGNNYVERKDLEDQLERAFTRIPDGRYSIVYGNKGVGKTELVTHAAIYNKKKKPSFYDKLTNLFLWKADYAYRYGVIKIKVRPGQQYSDVFAQLLASVYLPIPLLNLDVLEFHMKSVNWWWSSIYPTFIFDVECSKVESVNAVRAIAKDLAHTCRCIIVLSEANAILEAGDDNSREKFIFVDEFSRDEATIYLKKRKCNISESDMNYVFDNIGTSPARLVSLVGELSDGVTVQQFVDNMLEDALKGLRAFPLKTILQALKDHPDGVNPEYFNNLKEEGVDLTNPVAVGKIMKEKLNPLIFRQDLGLYQLISTAHKTALKSYKPINPLPIPT